MKQGLLSSFAMLALCLSANADELDSLLELDLLALSNIEIREVYGASKKTQKLIDAPANITIITKTEIQNRHYRTITDAVAAQSGFYKSYDRDYAYIGIRGFSSPGDYNSKILMLIDGQRTNENIYSSASVGTAALVNMDLIDHIEIIRGPGSAIYGSSAIFAVINVITKSAKDYENGEISVMVGNYGTDEERVTFAHTFDNDIEVLASASRYHSDGDNDLYFKEFDTPAQNNGRAQNIDDDDGYKLFLKSKMNDFELEVLFYNREKKVPTAPWETIFNKAVTNSDKQGLVNLKYDTDLSNKLSVKTSIAYNSYHFHGEYLYEDGGITTATDDAQAKWMDGYVDLSYQQNEKLSWLLGFYGLDSLEEAQSYVYDDVKYLDIDKPIDSYAFYLQNIYNVTEKLSFTTGLRYDHYDTIGGNVSPKASAIYKLSQVSSLKFIYGEAFRAPNAYELYYNDGDDVQKANPNLEEEKIKNYEIVFERYFSTNHSIILNGFYYEMENLIQQMTDADGLLVFKNLARAESKGVELSYRYRFDNGLDASLNYTHQKATDMNTGEGLVNSPENLANAAFTMPFADQYTAVFSLQYVGEKKNPNGEMIDEYTLSNVSLNAYDVIEGLDLFASVYNLFDSKYSSVGGEEHLQTEIFQNGISVRAKAVYKF